MSLRPFALALLVACAGGSPQDTATDATDLTPIPDGISADFPYTLHEADVLGTTMRYVDVSSGDRTFVLLHGNPTSAYLWRNIVPHLEREGRVVVPDLVGMGSSGKPDIAYTFRDHTAYLDALLAQLDVDDVILVVHDWGGPLGFHWARQHTERVRGLVFFETFLGPFGSLEDHFGPSSGDPDNPGVTDIMTAFRSGTIDDPTPGSGWDLLVQQNLFIEQMLPLMVATRSLTPEEHDVYRAPYLAEEDRLPVFMWPREIPVDGLTADGDPWVHEQFVADAAFLEGSPLPKLYLYAEPGSGLVTPSTHTWATELPAVQVEAFGPGAHFLQEDDPHRIGTAIVSWIQSNDP